jgi:hypothetical protein
MLAVVQLHDLTADGGSECGIVVRELWKCVFSHATSLCREQIARS